MSDENSEVLKQIAASLKSIDERLGLLLIGGNTNLKVIDGKSSFEATRLLLRSQRILERKTRDVTNSEKYEREKKAQADARFSEAWKLAFGDISDLRWLDGLEDLSEIETGLTFCDLAKNLGKCEGVTKNSSRRYDWLRREFLLVCKKLEEGPPYNRFLAGRSDPSRIKIDHRTAAHIAQIVITLLEKKVLKNS